MKYFVVTLTLLACLYLLGCGGSSNANSGSNTGSNGASNGSGGSGGQTGSSNPGNTGGSGSPTIAAVAYSTGSGNNFVGARVDSNSTMTATAGSPYALKNLAGAMALNGSLLYVADVELGAPYTTTLNAYTVATDGTLSQIATSTVPRVSALAFDSSGKNLYISSSYVPVSGQTYTQDGVYGYSVNTATGALTPLPGSPWTVTGASVGTMSVSPDGKSLCVDITLARTNDSIYCYARSSDGTIDTSKSNSPIGSNNSIPSMAISPDSSKIYAASANAVWYGSLSNGSSSANSVSSGGSQATAIAMTPSGKWLAVSNRGTKNVSMFDVSGGSPVAGPSVSTPATPGGVAFSNSGAYLFVSTDSGIAAYSVDNATGALTPASGSPLSGGVAGVIVAK